MVQSGFPLCENGPPNKGTQSVGGERRHHPDPHSTREERSAAALHNVKFAYLCCFGTRGRGVPVFARCHDVVFHAAFVVPGGGQAKKTGARALRGPPRVSPRSHAVQELATAPDAHNSMHVHSQRNPIFSDEQKFGGGTVAVPRLCFHLERKFHSGSRNQNNLKKIQESAMHCFEVI